jgi:hypothetical protein
MARACAINHALRPLAPVSFNPQSWIWNMEYVQPPQSPCFEPHLLITNKRARPACGSEPGDGAVLELRVRGDMGPQVPKHPANG